MIRTLSLGALLLSLFAWSPTPRAATPSRVPHGCPASCDDSNPCTVDACDPEGGCVNTPTPDIACEDKYTCTGPGVCVFAPPVVLDAGQVVPAVSSSASGRAVISIDPTEIRFRLSLAYENVDPGRATSLEIHLGRPGENGPALFVLEAPPNPTQRVVDASSLLPLPKYGVSSFADALEKIRAGETYLELHTLDHPDGEIRGQIVEGSGASCSSPDSCDDADACTVDLCDPASGCSHLPVDEIWCSDGDPCTDDRCDPKEGCLHENNHVCDSKLRSRARSKLSASTP